MRWYIQINFNIIKFETYIISNRIIIISTLHMHYETNTARPTQAKSHSVNYKTGYTTKTIPSVKSSNTSVRLDCNTQL